MFSPEDDRPSKLSIRLVKPHSSQKEYLDTRKAEMRAQSLPPSPGNTIPATIYLQDNEENFTWYFLNSSIIQKRYGFEVKDKELVLIDASRLAKVNPVRKETLRKIFREWKTLKGL